MFAAAWRQAASHLAGGPEPEQPPTKVGNGVWRFMPDDAKTAERLRGYQKGEEFVARVVPLRRTANDLLAETLTHAVETDSAFCTQLQTTGKVEGYTIPSEIERKGRTAVLRTWNALVHTQEYEMVAHMQVELGGQIVPVRVRYSNIPECFGGYVGPWVIHGISVGRAHVKKSALAIDAEVVNQ